MTPELMTAYVLIWPVIVACVLFYLLKAFFSEWIDAKRANKPLI